MPANFPLQAYSLHFVSPVLVSADRLRYVPSQALGACKIYNFFFPEELKRFQQQNPKKQLMKTVYLIYVCLCSLELSCGMKSGWLRSEKNHGDKHCHRSLDVTETIFSSSELQWIFEMWCPEFSPLHFNPVQVNGKLLKERILPFI